MNRSDERLLWILGILFLLWWVFGRAGFRFTAGAGPIGATFGLGTSGFTGAIPNGTTYGGGAAYSGGGCPCPFAGACGALPTGPVVGNFGDYHQG